MTSTRKRALPSWVGPCLIAFCASAMHAAALPPQAQTPSTKKAADSKKTDPLVGRLVMPIAGAKLRLEEKQVPLRAIPAPFVVRKVEGGWLWVGRAWIKRSDIVPIESALEYYSNWIKKNPKDSWAFDFRATTYHQRGNLEKALEDHTAAILLSPDDAHYYNNRGLVYFELQKVDEAMADYDQAIKLDPKFAFAYCNRGALRALQDLNKALADYQAAVECDPDCAEAYNGMAWIYATSRNVNFRDSKKAVEYAAKAAKLTSHSDLAILDTLAAAHAEAGQFDEAIKFQKRAMEFARGNVEFLRASQQRIKEYQAKKPYRE